MDSESYTLQTISRLDDLDQDGLHNADEVRLGGDLTAVDTDGDGIHDGVEDSRYNTSITAADTDHDGLGDAQELFEYETSPTDADTDDDGVPDDAELAAGYNATAPDTDGDGILDGAELSAGTAPTVADTDGDGLDDGREQRLGTDATASDTDGDGLSDSTELERGSDPLAVDTDGDGLDDGREVAAGTALLSPDTDGDGLDDGREQRLGTDPTAVDSDGDYLSDSVESAVGTDATSDQTLVLLSVLGAITVCAGLLLASMGRGYVCGTVARLRASARVFLRRVPTADSVALETAESATESEGSVDQARAASAEAVVEARASDDLVTDSEIVTEMLRAEGGRMKQSHIVEATDWSKAKVSRILSKKADDGDIAKLRLGRENLICLEHAQPAVMTSDPRTETGLSPPEQSVSGSI